MQVLMHVKANFYKFFTIIIIIIMKTYCQQITKLILLHGKLLQFDWLREVVFQLNLKYLHVKITNLL